MAASPTPPLTDLIDLQVGERRFTTRRDTLTQESAFFAQLLSGQWADKRPDGSYFIDSDPEVFHHILRYLRSSVLPIFFDRHKGHDFALYAAMLEQAQFFRIERLISWIEKKIYLKAVTIERSVAVLNDTQFQSGNIDADTEVEYYTTSETSKTPLCPSKYHNRRGADCPCLWTQGAAVVYVEQSSVRVVEIRKKTIFDHKMCLDG